MLCSSLHGELEDCVAWAVEIGRVEAENGPG